MFFPIMIDLKDKRITVVGGGNVCFRKCKNLLEFGAKVTIVSPEIIDKLKELKVIYKDNLKFIYDIYKEEYIVDSFLVVAATSSKEINREIVKNSKELNILVNSADGRKESDFITTSIIKNDNLTISICTDGRFPALSKKIRKDMEEKYSRYDEEYMNILEEIRYVIIEKHPEDKSEIMDKVLDLDIDQLREYKNKIIKE